MKRIFSIVGIVLLASLLGGCVQPGGEGIRSNFLDLQSGSLSDRREALRTVRVFSAPNSQYQPTGEIAARRCHRNFLEEAPKERAVLDDLKVGAFAQGADAITSVEYHRLPGLMANCWYVLEGRAVLLQRK